MPGLAGRMSTVVKAKISKMLDRAEDPGETLDYGYQKQTELLQNVKKGIADVVTSKKRLQMQSQKLEQQVVKLDTQARQALAQGREDLARTALERKNLAQTELQSLDQQIKELEAQQEPLIANEQRLRQKIEQFRTKKEVIKAQYSAAEAQVRISEAANGVGEEMADLGLAMQRAEDKTETMRARASAVEELEQAGAFDDITTLGSGQDDLDRQLSELTSGAQVDDELSEDEGRARLGRRRRAGARAGGGQGVIVRISGEGQFRLPDEDADRLNELDNRAVSAVEQGDETGFKELWSQMLELVSSDGNRIGDDELVESRRDPAAARHHVRGGLRRVHRRGPDSRLMDEEAFNLSVRRFLKKLGVTSQREIELAVRELLEAGALSGDETLRARAVVTVDGVEREIVVEGDIALSGEPSGSPK